MKVGRLICPLMIYEMLFVEGFAQSRSTRSCFYLAPLSLDTAGEQVAAQIIPQIDAEMQNVILIL